MMDCNAPTKIFESASVETNAPFLPPIFLVFALRHLPSKIKEVRLKLNSQQKR